MIEGFVDITKYRYAAVLNAVSGNGFRDKHATQLCKLAFDPKT